MEPDRRFWAGKRVCVTGGTGFLGWHLLRQLLPLTGGVRVLGLRPASDELWERLRPLDCVVGDVRDGEAVGRAVRDCDVVFHAAGPVAVWGPARKAMREIHLSGTRQVVQALPAGARLVHTSSVVAVGAGSGEPLTEESAFNLHRLKVDYVHAKREAEAVALAAAAAGRDVVVVNPGYLIGPEDYERSAMGRLCLRGWKGKMPLDPCGGLNFVDVRDAARGHLLAAERGRAGARYILGGENLTLAEFAARLAAVRGLPPRRRLCVPAWLQTITAWYAELRARFTGREPYPSLEHARMNRRRWYYSSERARTELGFHARPVEESLRDAHEWFCGQDQLQPEDGRPRRNPRTPARPAA